MRRRRRRWEEDYELMMMMMMINGGMSSFEIIYRRETHQRQCLSFVCINYVTETCQLTVRLG